MTLARLGNKYLADSEPWKLIKTDPERVKTIMNTALQIAAGLALLSEPFLPFTAKKLQQMLLFKEVHAEFISASGPQPQKSAFFVLFRPFLCPKTPKNALKK